MRHAVFFIAFLWCSAQAAAQSRPAPDKETDKPFVLGRTLTFYSAQLAENRTVNIYLPDDYNPADTTRYPVIYLLDGSADEDFIHIVGLVQYNTFPWINRIPKSIVVGIANVDRKRDFTFPSAQPGDKKLIPTSGHSDKFIAFIEKDLLPFIQSKYKTTPATTIIGQSLGGLVATEILFKKPELFTQYIIISPSLWWDDGSLLTYKAPVLQANFNRPIQVYIGVGKEGLAPVEKPHVMEVEANVLADLLKNTPAKNITTYFDYLPAENHATVTHQAVFNAFRLLYPAK